MKAIRFFTMVLVLVILSIGGMALAGTLDEVRSRGVLTVGVNGGVAGFSMPDEKGVWKGLGGLVCSCEGRKFG